MGKFSPSQQSIRAEPGQSNYTIYVGLFSELILFPNIAPALKYTENPHGVRHVLKSRKKFSLK